MATTTLQSKREIRDLRADTFRALSIMTANNGTNLKNSLRKSFDKVAEDLYKNTASHGYLTRSLTGFNLPVRRKRLSMKTGFAYESRLFNGFHHN